MMALHICNSSTSKTEAGRPRVEGQMGLQIETLCSKPKIITIIL